MNQYIIAVIFILIGFVGAWGHYIKDRYKEKKIDCSFWFYLSHDTESTYNMVKAVFGAAIPLAMVHGDGLFLSLSDVYAMLGAGYLSDSWLNHAYPPRDSHE